MKNKHNKKRNTAFLFEALVLELTKSIVNQDTNRSHLIKMTLHRHFSTGTALDQEMQCYKALQQEEVLDRHSAEKLLHLTKVRYSTIGQKKIFEAQSSLISEINKDIGREVYGNFVGGYKAYATMAQIFGSAVSLKQQVLLEKKIVEKLTEQTTPSTSHLVAPDKLEIRSFVKRYNEKYDNLLGEQKDLLTRYIVSLDEGAADFRIFVARELRRLEEAISSSFGMAEVKEDMEMSKNTSRVLAEMKTMSVNNINEKQLLKILKLQKLVNEYSLSCP
jgi:hypothetical protein